MDEILKRKGASSPNNVPCEVLTLINEGNIPTVNLGEALATDNRLLLKNICDDNKISLDISRLAETKLMSIYREIARLLLTLNERDFTVFSSHISDVPRCWACLSVGYRKVPLIEKLEMIKPFADDIHMGVREMAWMALRDDIAADIPYAVELLTEWTASESPYIRRCASEATRPRGVWCSHISRLKESPEIALSILEPLRSDSHKYVQDSVANWLNDASKSRPEWVISVTDRWRAESPTKETAKICKRALRTLNKK